MEDSHWSEEVVEFMFAYRAMNPKATWVEVAKHVSRKLGRDITDDAARLKYTRCKNMFDDSSDNFITSTLKKLRSARRTGSFNSRAANILLDKIRSQDEVLGAISGIVAQAPRLAEKIPSPPKRTKKYAIALELLLSDWHIGRLVQFGRRRVFDLAIATRRIQELSRVVLAEFEIQKKAYDVSEIVVACMGDMIENEHFHGIESARNSEFSTARQVQATIELLVFQILVPIARLGVPVKFIGVTGNHDRPTEKKSMVAPGEHNLTWIIYNTAILLLRQMGFSNVKSDIAEGFYTIHGIFGANVLYEHLDIRRPRRVSDFERMMADRGAQEGKVIDYVRGGHFHTYNQLDGGRAIVNMSLCGRDHFSQGLGYRSTPGQVLNTYLNFPFKLGPGERPMPFHKGFGVKLP